jgi:hypothetical protein
MVYGMIQYNIILCTKPAVVYIAPGQQTGSWVIGFFWGTFFVVNFVAFLTNKLGFLLLL